MSKNSNKPFSAAMPRLLTIVVLATLSFCPLGATRADEPSSQAIELRELWHIGHDDEVGPIFGLITDLCLDNEGFLYVVDQQLNAVTVFSPEGEFVRSIGREGGGPGEFRRPYRVFLTPSGEVCVLTGSLGHIGRFSRSGEHLGDISVPADGAGVTPIIRDAKASSLGAVFLGVYREGAQFVLPGKRVEHHRVYSVDGRAAELNSYFQIERLIDDTHPTWSERARELDRRWDVARDGRVFVARDYLDYEVSVYRADGELESVLSRDYDHRKRSKDEKQLVYDWATVNPNGNLPGTTFKIEDYDKDIMALYGRDDGRLWVLTSRGVYDRPSDSAGVFDVFDRDGEFDGRVTLVGVGNPETDRYVFSGNRLYVLRCFRSAAAAMVAGVKGHRFTELCGEPMSIICYEVEPDH